MALLLMIFLAQRMLLFPAPPNPVRCDAGRSYVVPIPTAGRPAGVSVLGVSVLECECSRLRGVRERGESAAGNGVGLMRELPGWTTRGRLF